MWSDTWLRLAKALRILEPAFARKLLMTFQPVKTAHGAKRLHVAWHTCIMLVVDNKGMVVLSRHPDCQGWLCGPAEPGCANKLCRNATSGLTLVVWECM